MTILEFSDLLIGTPDLVGQYEKVFNSLSIVEGVLYKL